MLVKAEKRDTMDMTEGNTVKIILRFAFPLMVASIIQQLFSLTDAMVLGIYGGNESLAVLGACSWMNWFQISMLTNLGQASCLLAAVRIGAKNIEELKKAVGNIYLVSIILGIFLAPAMQLFVVDFLKLQNTPEEIFQNAVWYLRIVLLGTVFLLIYNVLSSLLRAAGDSNTSFQAITVAAVVNLIVDIILVAGFGMGVKGAAAATALSQMISAVICWMKIRKYPEFRLDKKLLRPDREILKEYTDLCIPMMAQSFVISIGGSYVQSQTNQFGVLFAAGVSAGGKIFTLMETGGLALASACASFIGQNVGARQFDRIRAAVKQIIWISLGMAASTGIILRLFGPSILQIFTQEEAVYYGIRYLEVYSISVMLMYPMYSMRQAVQALGNVRIPLVAAVLQLCMRVLTAGYLTKLIGYEGIYYTSAAAWFVTLILVMGVYPRQFQKCREKYL